MGDAVPPSIFDTQLTSDQTLQRGKRVLITGGAGFIGSNLSRYLLSKKYVVHVVDNLITGRQENIFSLRPHRDFHFYKMDVVCSGFVRLFKTLPIDHIYHLACPTGVPNIKTLGEEMLATSSIGTRNVLELARIHNARILYTSSAEVYGNPLVAPQKEEYCGNVHPLGDRSAYEEGKRFAESMMKLYVQKYGVSGKIVRIFNTYGPGMSFTDTRVFPQFIKSVLSGENFRIYGDGSQTRTCLYIDDLVRGLSLVIQRGKAGEVYNIGGNEMITIKDLAHLILEISGKNNVIDYHPHFIEDHTNRLPFLEKISALGWKQKIPLRKGLYNMMVASGVPLAKKDTRVKVAI